MEVIGLFPIPVGIFKYDNEITKAQNIFINSREKSYNVGNIKSNDTNILKSKELISINSFITKSLEQYYEYMYNPEGKSKIKITQSWLNWTEKGQYHHIHKHTNSFLSGVFYIDADEKQDRIFFQRDHQTAITPHMGSYNVFTADEWWLPVETGKLVIFPSTLSHSVQQLEDNKTRVSLAFNTFLYGDLGNENSLSLLRLNSKN